MTIFRKEATTEDVVDLIKWLKTKDPNETYHPGSGTNCLLAQYFRSKGRNLVIHKEFFNISGDDYVYDTFYIPAAINYIALGLTDTKQDCPPKDTFGNAYNRAYKMLRNHNFGI